MLLNQRRLAHTVERLCRCSVAFKRSPGNWFERLFSVSPPFFFFLATKKATMAKVQVLNVAVLDNPSPFGNPFQFEITFECMEDLPEGRYHDRKSHCCVCLRPKPVTCSVCAS